MGLKSYIFYFNKTMDKRLKDSGILTRPLASPGLWLSCLVPLAYMINTARHVKSAPFEYKLTTIVAFGLFVYSAEIFIRLGVEQVSKVLNFAAKMMSGGFISFLVWICLKQSIPFSLISGFGAAVLFEFLYFYLLKALPKSFTLGEAAVVLQGLYLFLYNLFIRLPDLLKRKTPSNEMQEMQLVLQIGLAGVLFLVLCVHLFHFLRKTVCFYLLFVAVVAGVMIFPIGERPAVVILFDFVFKDAERMLTVALFSVLLGISFVAAAYYALNNAQSSTSLRKIFHVLTVAVFIPGLVYQCAFLYVASVVILAVFVVLETARVIKLYPVYEALDAAVSTFVDEKDAGMVALTPLYLLAGCSLPLWIHPAPCNLADSAGFQLLPLLSGILAVGVGDTFASFVGATFGKHKWPNSPKSLEGTIASIVAQHLILIILYIAEMLFFTLKRGIFASVAITLNALTEAWTDQVDNLILPLVTFIVLSLC